MTFDDMLRVFDSWGYPLKTEYYWDFKQYCQTMLRRKRVIIVMNGEEIQSVVFFFLTNDYLRLYKKSEFETPDDKECGFQMYVDKMICKHWTPAVRRSVQDIIEERFPHVKEAYYHRAPNDRCVTIRRRASLCKSS